MHLDKRVYTKGRCEGVTLTLEVLCTQWPITEKVN